MDNALFYVVVFVLGLGILFALRLTRGNKAVDGAIAELCQELGIPNVPYDFTAGAREVVAGRRPGIPRDGQWWIFSGLEYVGRPSMTRLLEEDAVPDLDAVHGAISALFESHSGPSAGGMKESSVVQKMSNVHPDILLARITGSQRPIGGWLVAVPPWAIGSK